MTLAECLHVLLSALYVLFSEDYGDKNMSELISDLENISEFLFNNGYNSWGNTIRKAVSMLKEQTVRELTINEWREWKANPKRNPICKLWENDTSPMWILNPNDVHELALLMGKLKLFTGKPTFEQCKAVKWG